MHPAITQILNHPVVKASCIQVAAEVSKRGLFDSLDKALDYVAEKIAQEMIRAENKEKERKENGI